MIRILLVSFAVVASFSIGLVIYILVQSKKEFINNFQAKGVVTEISIPYAEKRDYQMMKFSDGKSLSIPDDMLGKVKVGDSVIKYLNQVYLVWKTNHTVDTIPL